MRHRYEFPRPALTVDIAAVRGGDADREILLIKRGAEPFLGSWALPGGFVDEDEPLVDAARRELAEETSVAQAGPLAQIGTYGDPGRDPRGWTVSVLFLARFTGGGPTVRAGDDAADAAWFPVWDLPELAFDHADLVADAIRFARRTERRSAPQ